MPSHNTWRSQASLAKYPFSDHASMVSEGGVALPRAIFSDLSVVAAGSSGLYLGYLYAGADYVLGEIYGADGSLAGEFEWDMSAAPAEVTLGGSPRGVAIFSADAPLEIADLPAGGMTFAPDALPLSPCAYISLPAGDCVGSIEVGGQVLRGRVDIRAGAGVALSLSGSHGEKVIRVDAMGEQDQAEYADADGGIKNINGVDPDEFGGIRILPSLVASPSNKGDDRQMVKIERVPSGLTIKLVEDD